MQKQENTLTRRQAEDELFHQEDLPIPAERHRPVSYFLGFFAGENISGTAFVIGVSFIVWGAGPFETILGLFIGATLAVISYTVVTTRLAIETRVSLYTYLKRIAGPWFTRFYNVINGIISCIMAGAMIAVTASALRVVFDIPVQNQWYPTSVSYVAIVVISGLLITFVAAFGFNSVARFASVCTPWLVMVFVAGIIVAFGVLINQSGNTTGTWTSIREVSHTVWPSNTGDNLTIWHVAAYTWGITAFAHLGLTDMAVMRYGKNQWYGLTSAAGQYGGFVLAYVSAGALGAAAVSVSQYTFNELDSGMIAYLNFGIFGLIVIAIAGWSTSNPAIYRAGLAFQSLRPGSSERASIIITGCVVTLVACFPLVFNELVNIIAIYSLILIPVGSIVVTEHWILPRFGLTRYWSFYRRHRANPAALSAWFFGAVMTLAMISATSIHLYFMFPIVFVVSSVAYVAFARVMGALGSYEQQKSILEELDKEAYQRAIEIPQPQIIKSQLNLSLKLARQSYVTRALASATVVSLAIMVLASWLYGTQKISLGSFDWTLIIATFLYFTTSVSVVYLHEVKTISKIGETIDE